jgi:arylsulfatase A-like enzyme
MECNTYGIGRKMMLAAMACGNVGAFGFSASAVKAPKGPNILLLIADDLKEGHLGFTSDGTTALTPHMDRFAQDGVYFSRAYVSSSVCTPSRYSILTGRYASRAGTPEIERTAAPNGQIVLNWQTWIYPDADHLARLLGDAGYFTGYVGKCDVFKRRQPLELPLDADPRDPQIRDILIESQQRLIDDVKSTGFDYAASLGWGNPPHNPIRELQGHNIEWEVKGALDFLDVAAQKKKPFFLTFATTLLHWPDPMIDIRNADTRRTYMGYLDEPLEVQPSRPSTIDRVRAAGLDDDVAITTWFDDGIGALLTRLDDLGLTEDTLVVFINDNSTDGGKGSNYESGAHVPMIISWKGVLDGGLVSDALVGNIDIVPTICEAAGVEIPDSYVLDGKSLWPHLRGETPAVHESLFLEIGNSRAIVTKEGWKYIAVRIPYNTEGIPKEEISQLRAEPGRMSNLEHLTMRLYPDVYWDLDQFFDLQNDPNETKNEWMNPEVRPQRENLINLMEHQLEEMPGTFPLFPDETTPEDDPPNGEISFTAGEGYTAGPLRTHPNWRGSGTDFLVDPTGDGSVTNIGASTFKNMTYQKPLPSGALEYTVSTVISFDHVGEGGNGADTVVYAASFQHGEGDLYLFLQRRSTSENFRMVFYDQNATTTNIQSDDIRAVELGLNGSLNESLSSDRLKLSMTITRGADEKNWSVSATMENLDSAALLAALSGSFDTTEAFFNDPVKAGFNSRQSVSDAALSPITLHRFEAHSGSNE